MFEKIDSLVNTKGIQYFVFFMLLMFLIFMIILPFTSNDCESTQLVCRWDTLIETWRQWQTFNASIIAFVSTILVIYSTTITDRNNRIKKRNASKAFLSSAFADLSTHIKKIVLILDDIRTEKIDCSSVNKPLYPSDAFTRIEKFIEASDRHDKLLVEHLIFFINSLQVHHSRLDSLIKDKWITNKKESAFYQINQCIRLHSLLSGMFSFVRDKESIYEAETLNKERFDVKDLPHYMTNEEIEKYSTQRITLELFCSD